MHLLLTPTKSTCICW